MTEWRDIANWEGVYQVSDAGRVARLVNGDRRLLAPYVSANGYALARLCRDGIGTPEYVHRLVLAAFDGPPQAGREGCHRNGVRTDNRIENLYWGTRSQNILDAVKHRTHHQAGKTHCKRGHEFSEENIIRTPEGHRRCKTCTYARRRAIRSKESTA